MRERIEELIRLNKYTDLKELLVTMNVADIAELIEELPELELVKVFRLLQLPLMYFLIFQQMQNR